MMAAEGRVNATISPQNSPLNRQRDTRSMFFRPTPLLIQGRRKTSLRKTSLRQK